MSLRRVAIGFALGAVIGLFLCAVSGLSRWGQALVDPPVQELADAFTDDKVVGRSGSTPTRHRLPRPDRPSRRTARLAWAEAGKLLDALDQAQISTAQAQLAASDSVGQQRMVELHQGGFGKGLRGLEIYPGLWAGVGLVRGGAGTALVGSHSEVADLIAEYHALGVSEFIFSGYPHLGEAYWFGEGVRPEPARRGLLEPSIINA